MKTYDPDRRHRRSIRLKGYDYSQPGAYFVTICTQHRKHFFGTVEDGAMRLNEGGRPMSLPYLGQSICRICLNRQQIKHMVTRLVIGLLVGSVVFGLLNTSPMVHAGNRADSLWTTSQQDTAPDLPAYLLWLVVGGAGMFGGFLFGIRDKRLILPHRDSKYVIRPGFIGDCLFGLAGGFLVFILLPGSFEFNLNQPEEIMKIVAVAVVGGYGGRALVEKVLAQQFYELESDIEELRQQNRQGAMAIALVRQHLDEDQDTPLIPDDELKETILNASSSAKVEVFDRANTFRKKHYERRPELLPRTIPIFQALIEDDEDEKYHRNHGQLGYIYKDQRPHPQWKLAEAELSKAIDIRDKNHVGGFVLYELNRAICNIQLGASFDLIKSDLDTVLRLGPEHGLWVRRPHPQKARLIIEWMRENEEGLEDWMRENDIQLPDADEET